MASRFIAQLVVNGVSILSRAFITAYQQALHNAKSGGAANATVRAVRHRISTDEAMKILHIERAELNPKVVEEKYQKFFAANDPAKGGSFYLQSKIHRSKEALLSELEEIAKGNNPGQEQAPPGDNADPTQPSDKQQASK